MHVPARCKGVCFVSAQEFLSPQMSGSAKQKIQKLILFNVKRPAIKKVPSSLFVSSVLLQKKLEKLVPTKHKVFVTKNDNAVVDDVRKMLTIRKVPFEETVVYRRAAKPMRQPIGGSYIFDSSSFGRHSNPR